MTGWLAPLWWCSGFLVGLGAGILRGTRKLQRKIEKLEREIRETRP